jgi:hypothetical protein
MNVSQKNRPHASLRVPMAKGIPIGHLRTQRPSWRGARARSQPIWRPLRLVGMIHERCSSAPPPGVASEGGPMFEAVDCPGKCVLDSEAFASVASGPIARKPLPR